MLAKLAAIWERISTSLWFLPTMMSLAALLLVWGTLQVRLDLGESRYWWLHQGDASDASELLSSLLTALITMASVVISITMVVLTLAAQQLGPRLIRNFMGDWRTQAVLGLFIATIIYVLLVLRTFNRSMTEEEVPHVAVTVGTFFVLLCVVALLYYVHHLARSIIADTTIKRVGSALDHAIRDYLPAHEHNGNAQSLERSPDTVGFGLHQSGYVQAIDFEGLAAIACEHRVTVELTFRPGHHLLAGGCHVIVWPSKHVNDDLQQRIADAVVIGGEPTAAQDVEFAVRQLVEVALRALSPSMNDPFTAIAAIDRLSSSLALALQRSGAQRIWRDEGQTIRLMAPTATFTGIIDAAFNQIRQSGAGHPDVLIRLMTNLAQLAELATTDEQRAAIARHAALAAEAGRRSIAEPLDRAVLDERYDRVRKLLPEVPGHETATGA